MRGANGYRVAVPFGSGRLRLVPDNQARSGEASSLALEVFYTTDQGTRRALEKAWGLAQGLGAHVRLVFIYAVPYALPLTKPPVSLSFLQDKLAKLASCFPDETSVHIFLCRQALSALQDALPNSSLVVLGGRRHWWLAKGQRMERRLKKLGHHVIFAESG